MKKHKHHKEIIAWANGESIQLLVSGTGGWEDIPIPSWAPGSVYRVKPKFVKINDILFPQPLQNMEIGDTYYVADILGGILGTPLEFKDSTTDREWLKKGLCHSTQEGARGHVEALLLPTRQ